MDIPPKRKSNRSQRRAAQRGPEAQDAVAPVAQVAQPAAAQEYVPAPPASCEPWHFYWCNGHHDWHHHEEDALNAIAASMAPPA